MTFSPSSGSIDIDICQINDVQTTRCLLATEKMP